MTRQSRPARFNAHWYKTTLRRLVLPATICAFTGPALAQSFEATPLDGGSITRVGTDFSVRTGRVSGAGLMPWRMLGNYSATLASGPAIGLGATRLPARAFGSAFAKLDSGHRDDAFALGASSLWAGDRFELRSQVHATRLSLHPGSSDALLASRYHVSPEIALAFRLRHDLSVGTEYRHRPDNRKSAGPFGSRAGDGAWKDVYIVWSPTSNFSLTAAYIDLGNTKPLTSGERQIGHYLSAEFWY